MRLNGLYSTGDSSLSRSLLAFAVAPVISIFLVISAVAMIPVFRVGERPYVLLQNFLGVVCFGTFFGTPLTYLGMLWVGFPTWLLLRFTGNESGIAYAVSGTIGGWLLAPAFFGPKISSYPIEILGIPAGSLSLFLFWCIARRR